MNVIFALTQPRSLSISEAKVGPRIVGSFVAPETAKSGFIDPVVRLSKTGRTITGQLFSSLNYFSKTSLHSQSAYLVTITANTVCNFTTSVFCLDVF